MDPAGDRPPLITSDMVQLDLRATDKSEAIEELARAMAAAGRVTDVPGFLTHVAAREAQMPTGLEGGVGIPHCRSRYVTSPSVAFGRSTAGVHFGAKDGPAHVIFLISTPEQGGPEHLRILAALARHLARPQFVPALRAAGDPAEVALFLDSHLR